MAETQALARLRSAQRVGLLFSGGGGRCVFQVGVIEELVALGIKPGACLGVSIGAWNAAAVAIGNLPRLRYYWEFFCRMPRVDIFNVFRQEHSPFMYTRIHERAYRRYVGNERIFAPSALPLLVGVTRMRDKACVVLEARKVPDPFKLLLASNYLPPFFTHTLDVDGERYGDGGYSNNIPYEALFEAGCDAVVIMGAKGESEGGLYRNPNDFEHVIPPPYRDKVVVIRPRHRLPLAFTEQRWTKLRPFARLGALRTREVLLGEHHPECDIAASGTAFTVRVAKLVRRIKSIGRGSLAPQPQPSDQS